MRISKGDDGNRKGKGTESLHRATVTVVGFRTLNLVRTEKSLSVK